MKLVALLLAAGRSQRFNNIKQLADVNGMPMICHCLEQYYNNGQLISGIEQVRVVLGANVEKIKPVLPTGTTTYVSHNWKSGMGSSLSDAMNAIPKNTTHVLVGLADQVAVDQNGLEMLIHAYKAYPNKIIASRYNGKAGVPAIFPRTYFGYIAQLSGDQGAKGLLQREAENLHTVDLPNAAMDIDSPEDLLDYLSSNQSAL